MTELRQDLASLRIDREAPARRRPRWPIVLVLAFVIGGAAFFALRDRLAPQGIVVETVRAAIAPVAGPASGTAILSASGYVVPRRKAVVSSKIQGRLADLRVEEGSRVREGEVIARLESADFVAQVQRARATVQRAEADLAENRRLLRLSENLVRDKIVSEDQVDAARSRVTIGEAALEQARADQALSEALFQNTQIRAPFSGTVLKKMAEVGESVAPIPPGVNISSSSGAIVALADLETLEVEADVGESNVAKLGPDQPAEVAVEAFPDRRYKAVLRQIIPTADRTKATVQVKVTILDRDDKLKRRCRPGSSFWPSRRRSSPRRRRRRRSSWCRKGRWSPGTAPRWSSRSRRDGPGPGPWSPESRATVRWWCARGWRARRP